MEHPLNITLTPSSLPDVQDLFIHANLPPLMYSMKTKPLPNYSVIFYGNSDTLPISSICSMNVTIRKPSRNKKGKNQMENDYDPRFV